MQRIVYMLLSFIISCQPNNSWNNNAGRGVGPLAVNNRGVPNAIPDATNTNMNEWGGVTCARGSSRDQIFRDFLSSGIEVYDERKNPLGEISCTPGNQRGFLMKARVTLLGQFNASGSNPSISMQTQTSSLEIHIFDGPVPRGKQVEGPITITMRGKSGTVSSNQAHLVFEDEKGSVTLEGTFNNNEFTGTISFINNVVRVNGATSSPGKQGTLGTFRLNTRSTFYDTSSPSF